MHRTNGSNDHRPSEGRPSPRWTVSVARSVWPSSAWATARAASSRVATTTRTPPADAFVPGLMHVDLGGYHVRDIEFVAAFDVNAGKVGQDLSEAICAAPNNTIRFADVPRAGCPRPARADHGRHRPLPA